MLTLALDRAPENRTYDRFGKLHVRVSNIAKATVNPYRGSEIPNFRALSLDADKVYMLLRSPEELEKAAPSFNNIPILQRHVPVTTADPQQEEVVGSTGTDCAWGAPYLTNSLVIWVDGAIAGIESEDEHEISPGYAYEADMTPGEFEGLPYDGIMRNIVANHLALVSQGRQGPDIVVGDAKPEISSMAALKSRKALLLHGALSAALLPVLAQDAKIDISSVLGDVTAANYKERKPKLIADVRALVAGKLAQDADLDGVVGLLDKLDDMKDGAPDDQDMLPAQPAEDDADPMAKFMEFCRGKMADDDFNELVKMAGGEGATDEDDVPAAPEGGADKPGQAMDSAKIAKQVQRRVMDIASATALVEPIVGKIKIAHDSADPILQLALDHLKIDATGVNTAGKRLLIEQRVAAEARAKNPDRQVIAQDSGANDAEEAFRRDFPTAVKLRR